MPYPEGAIVAMKNLFLFAFISVLFLSFIQGNHLVGDWNNAYAQQDWKQEYAAVCAKTQNAMTLSVPELKDYIDRCDKLQDRINELDGMQGETERKIYTKRLKMCRDLYEFTLEYLEYKDK